MKPLQVGDDGVDDAVFVDVTGRRARRVATAGALAGVLMVVYLMVLLNAVTTVTVPAVHLR